MIDQETTYKHVASKIVLKSTYRNLPLNKKDIDKRMEMSLITEFIKELSDSDRNKLFPIEKIENEKSYTFKLIKYL